MEPSPLITQFLRHRDAILAYLLALTRDYRVAEEVFQEVGLAVVDEARKEARVDNFPAWVREIARRRAAAYYRQQPREQTNTALSESLADLIDLAFQENSRISEEEPRRLQFLRECMALLAGRGKDVIEQKYGQGRTNATIAQQLNWTIESVKVALSRSRRTLRECIERKLRQCQAADDTANA